MRNIAHLVRLVQRSTPSFSRSHAVTIPLDLTLFIVINPPIPPIWQHAAQRGGGALYFLVSQAINTLGSPQLMNNDIEVC